MGSSLFRIKHFLCNSKCYTILGLRPSITTNTSSNSLISNSLLVPQHMLRHMVLVSHRAISFHSCDWATTWHKPRPRACIHSSILKVCYHAPCLKLAWLTYVEHIAVRKSSSNSSLQTSALRGPPRKPKQSGHALWVGNLPPATHIIDLKDHFARDATDDIESVFLISKSNCAFVNYKSDASCAAAITLFHYSSFQGVRLVCRLRRVSASTTTPTSTISQRPTVTLVNGDEVEEAGKEATVTDSTVTAEPDAMEKVKEKYFVVKSLTVEDLERSVVSGIWATQAHNEAALNTAYQVSASPISHLKMLTMGRQPKMSTWSFLPTSLASISGTLGWNLPSTMRLAQNLNTSLDQKPQSQVQQTYH